MCIPSLRLWHDITELFDFAHSNIIQKQLRLMSLELQHGACDIINVVLILVITKVLSISLTQVDMVFYGILYFAATSLFDNRLAIS